MKHQRLSAILLALALGSALRAQGTPPSPGPWQHSLDEYLAGVLQTYQLMGDPRAEATVGGLRGVYAPLVRSLDHDPVRLVQVGHGPRSSQVLDSATPAGREALLGRVGLGLGAGMAWAPVDDEPSRRVLARYRAALDETTFQDRRPAPLTAVERHNPWTRTSVALTPEQERARDFGDFAGQVHSQLAPAVLATMKEVPGADAFPRRADGSHDPATLADMAAWHRFFVQAERNYLPQLEATHGVLLAPEDLRSLEPARARAATLEVVLAEAAAGDAAAPGAGVPPVTTPAAAPGGEGATQAAGGGEASGGEILGM